ncbi:MAG: M13 family metallopeptidase [Paludibacteraceae bacterium]|nr:M13 family metallopeptidase [Paludibacteraceae bacterium]
MIKRFFIMGCVSSLLFASCADKAKKVDGFAHFSSDFDTTVAQGDDFYQFSNGGWLKTHPIPGEKSRLNTFDVLNDENLERLRVIVEQARDKHAAQGSNEQKIGDYYALAMDSLRRQKEGIEPIRPIIERIQSMSFNVKDSTFAENLAYFHFNLGNPFFAVGCTPDSKNSSMNIAELWQDGIGLPNRDYYFDESEKGQEIIQGYKRMVAKYLELIGVDSPESRANAVYDFEKKLAGQMNTKVQNRDPQAVYNKSSFDDLKKNYPDFNWDAYFNAFPVKPSELTVGQPRYFSNLFKTIAETDSITLSDYLLVATINYVASYLSDDYMMAKFDFYSKQLSGIEELKPLWKRSLDMVQNRLGQPLGQLFVEKHFPMSAKNRTIDLIEHLRTAFGQRIDALTWMGDSTKAAAKVKLAAIGVKVGYPDKWEDFSGAEVAPSLSLVENFIRLTNFCSIKEMKEVGQPVDKEKWYMTPQTVNAYYSPMTNEIVFPAGILQPPFFYADGDDAVNYGAIGVVIGHEMTHGFDDQGRQFDKDGNLTDWWTAEDENRFKSATEKIIERFSNVVVIDTMRCNGKLTQGENIADLGGLNIAHQAFLNTLTDSVKDPMVDGQSFDQRFLLAYSRIWAGNYRDEYLRNQVITDSHANGKYRVNVQLPMLDFFYSAFGIDEKDKMFVRPEERIEIW